MNIFFNFFNRAMLYRKSKIFADIALKKVHITLADSRSGSTFFQENLNCNPQNTEFGEVYGNRILTSIIDSRKQINYFSQLVALAETPAAGCKITMTQFVRNVESIDFVKAYRQCKYIVLERENVVASAVSLLIAQKTGLYHSRNIVAHDTKHIIDPVELKMLIEYRRAFRSITYSLLSLLSISFHKISYESLIKNHIKVLNEVFDFLDLPHCNTSSSLKKISSNKLSDKIQNYDELREYFIDTDEFSFFD